MFSKNKKIILSVLAILLVTFGISAVVANDGISFGGEGECIDCTEISCDHLEAEDNNVGYTGMTKIKIPYNVVLSLLIS